MDEDFSINIDVVECIDKRNLVARISRQVQWIESIDDRHQASLKALEEKLAEFYSTNPDYYSQIDFTANNWIDKDEIAYSQIVRTAKDSRFICEVGCGGANILKYYSELASLYSGCDFSNKLINENKKLYPEARFLRIDQPNKLPYQDSIFDFVFSVFVLEHSTNPALLLDECTRILKPSGKLIILCPDFLGRRRMTSQRAGWSAGTSRQKLRRGKLLDSVLTLFDNRIRIPFYCKKFLKKASLKPAFFVNTAPIVFEDPFSPDVDAVYVAYKLEIENYLSNRFAKIDSGDEMIRYERSKGLIYLSFIRR